MFRAIAKLTVPCLAACLAACLPACASGGEKPAAKGADAAASEAAPATPAADEADEAAAEEKAEPAAPAASQPKPIEILTAPDVAFAFDYNNSGLKEKHEEKCKAVKDNPSALAKCLEKERATFRADVLQFTKDPEGKYVWIVLQRKGNSMVEVFQSPVEFADETGTTVTLKLTGQGRGSQQIFTGKREIPLSLPDRYGLIIEDPTYGKLPYGSKVGIVAAKSQ